MKNPIKEFLIDKITRKRLKKFLAKYSSDMKLVLDLGCADGKYRKYFPNRIGLDIKQGKGVDIIGDAHDLPFENGKFDMVLCTEVLEHLHSPHIAISEMSRVLKKGGMLILTTRFIFSIHDAPNDYYRFTKYGLQFLLKDKFEIIEMEEETSTKDTFAVLLQRVGYQTDLIGGKFTKALVFLAARLVYLFPSLIKKEFGDIGKTIEEKSILTSAYYLACKKI
jgi:SAM-dependent methyltransferase